MIDNKSVPSRSFCKVQKSTPKIERMGNIADFTMLARNTRGASTERVVFHLSVGPLV